MNNIFIMRLDQIQPCQLFVNSEELSNVLREYDKFKPELLEPLPVKRFGRQVILTDGHTIALAAFMRGISEIRVFWDDEELDWDAYQTCVEWCKNEGVHSIADLKDRVVSAEQFDLVWLKRCKQMVQELEAKRNAVSPSSVTVAEDQKLIESK
jgi:hypothetical protein